MNIIQDVLDTAIQYNEGLEERKINRKKEFFHNHGDRDTVNQVINSRTTEDYPKKGVPSRNKLNK